MVKKFLRSAGFQAALTWLLGFYLTIALRTTRWTLHGEEHLPYETTAVAACWHQRLPMMPALWLLAKRRGVGGSVSILASRHRDGRALGAIMRWFGVTVVHGSTARKEQDQLRDKGGRAGLRQLVANMKAGHHVVITPDGPRGPAFVAAAGVAQLAQLADAPVLPAAAQVKRRLTLNSWDKMIIPLPFGRGVVVCQPQIRVERDDRDQALARIQASMTEAMRQADRLIDAS